MALHYEGKEPRDVLYDRQTTLDLVCAVKKNCRGGSDVGKMVNTLRSRGLQAHTDWTPTFAEIKQNLQNGHPVILFVWNGAHAAVAVGYEDSGAITINDPYGGVSWWVTGQGKNIPPGPTPKLNGHNVEYSSIGGLSLSGAIFITGPSPAGEPVAAVIGASGGTLTGEGIRIDFPPASARRQVAATSPLTVTYTPQISSTHPISGFEGGITYFQLNATDVNGQPVGALGVPFTLTVDVDMSIVDSWDIEIGQVAEDGTPAPSSSTPVGEAIPVLARWNDALQRWAIISTAFDTTSGKLTARDDHFAEFAVLVQRQYGVYLPIVVRR